MGGKQSRSSSRFTGLTENEKETIRISWDMFMEQWTVNSMNSFTMLLLRRPEFVNDYGLVGLSNEEIMEDALVKRHAGKLTDFMDQLVHRIDDQIATNSLIEEIAEYYTSLRLPCSIIIEYKDFLIRYMVQKEYITKSDQKAWHKFLDKQLKPLKNK